MGNTPSCFVMGADTLLQECGELLLEQGWDLRGVVTTTPRLADWARKKGIRPLDPTGDLFEPLGARPFDYLFCIAQHEPVPANVRALPTRAAIAFHDGPLPRYAGRNAPAWALIAGETEHGVSWFTMADDEHAGDLLVQRRFPIDAGDTSLTLNSRCFGEGLEAFRELIAGLGAESLSARPQDLSQRSHWGPEQRPPAACVLDWRRPAAELEALVRALDFGNRYPNALGSPLVAFGGEALVVTHAQAGPRTREAAPGSIVAIEDEAIRVAAGEGELALQGLATRCGVRLDIPRAAGRLKLRENARFELLSAEQAERLTRLNATMARSEPAWVERLAALEPLALPYVQGDADSAPRPTQIRVEVPAAFRTRFGADAGEALLAAVAVFLSKLGDQQTFHLAFQDAALRADTAELSTWVATHVPLRCAPGRGSFLDALAALREELAEVRARGSWLLDAVGRQPELRGRGELLERFLPVGLEQWDGLEDCKPNGGTVLTLAVDAGAEGCLLAYDASLLPASAAATLQRQLGLLLGRLAAAAERPLRAHDLLSDDERQRLLVDWNRTETSFRADASVHQLIEEQAARTPTAVAAVWRDQELSYGELNARANQLAAHLRELGVGPERVVGVCLERSVELVVGLLGVLKAGAAFVPIDPAYPKTRVSFILEDTQAPVLLTQDRLVTDLPEHAARVLRLDADWPSIAERPADAPSTEVDPGSLACLGYVSAADGRPSGVQLEHRNLLNLFAAMDARVPRGDGDSPGTWLALTDLSADMALVELLWTLSAGFKVVLAGDPLPVSLPSAVVDKELDFGVFLWGSDDGEGRQKYRLLLETTKFADEHGFCAVWTPERHFHAFGGPYPNPSVTSAALATMTQRIQIRAGCCVLPLHHPVRVAEEWAMVDNLSNGRVGIGIAAGWMPADFVIRPESLARKKEVMYESIELLRRLWRGEAVPFPNADGELLPTRTLPRPIQPEVPIWVTTAGNPASYIKAGEIGANILTHLLGQTVEEVAEKIQLYRKALQEHGHDPSAGTVTLMLHTFVGDDDDVVRDIVRGPMKAYLGSAVSLVAKYAWTFPTYRQPGQASQETLNQLTEEDIASLSPEEADVILENAFTRYFETSGLFGTPETCLRMVDSLKAIGVDEVGCLLDYGVPTERVLESLPNLNRLRELANAGRRAEGEARQTSLAAQIRRHGVTHLQCTPSMVRLLVTETEGREALRSLHHLLVGGEVLPPAIASELVGLGGPNLTNLYGLIETTVWSTGHSVLDVGDSVPIGKPLANTSCYVLDRDRRPVPAGVPGELYIGGAGVARGYHGRAELSAARFVPDPYRGGMARMFRTGDRVRHREDGVLEFLGRSDRQVKLRGRRVELGEVETHLLKHPSVKEARVVLRDVPPGEQRLVAYVVPEGVASTPGNLRSHLRRRVPELMVPAHYVTMERGLPLRPDGALDPAGLPTPEALQAPTPTAYAPPESELEQQVAQLWQETLGLERVGADDNFFDIGGHSLLVLRMHRRLQELVSKPVSLTDLYRFPTVRTLSEFLSGEDKAAEEVKKSSERGQRRRASLQRRRRRARR